MLKMTPASVRHDFPAVDLWHRLHGIEAKQCAETRVFPWLRMAAFRILDCDRSGRAFLVWPFLGGDPDISQSWWLRRLRIPPALEWCEG